MRLYGKVPNIPVRVVAHRLGASGVALAVAWQARSELRMPPALAALVACAAGIRPR
jgi:hypothetical protein